METPRFGCEGGQERDGNGGKPALPSYLSQGQEGPTARPWPSLGGGVAPGHWTLTSGVQDRATHLPQAVSLRRQETLGTEHRGRPSSAHTALCIRVHRRPEVRHGRWPASQLPVGQLSRGAPRGSHEAAPLGSCRWAREAPNLRSWARPLSWPRRRLGPASWHRPGGRRAGRPRLGPEERRP